MFTRIGLLIGVLALCAGAAHATYLFDWSTPGPHILTVTDPSGDSDPGLNTGADITQVLWARDLNNTYFRMDLLNGYAGANLYGIYLADLSGPGSPGGDHNVPTNLDGSNVSYFTTVPRNADYLNSPPELRQYVWNTGTSSFDMTTNPANNIVFQVSPYPTYNIPGVVTLEWQIPNTQLPNSYAFWGGTMSWSSGDVRHTVDITNQGVTPEPTTLALLGLGLGGMWFKRRRKA